MNTNSKHHTNRLIKSTSPYLLQHAHNPVDWYEWGPEAIEKATREDKPILVSIGYSSCHWCHVMERESFENNDVAQVMNEHYVCIKVDREERPDIDQIYMDAVQALGVNGGWPLNVFLTPQQKPFFGGTYFSPQAWVQVLTNINRAFLANRQQVESTAHELSLHLLRSTVQQYQQPAHDAELPTMLEAIYKRLESSFDTTWGGMERAPKFIMPSVWQWLLRYHHLTGNDTALQQVVLTLKKVAMGGIYDQVGGGFARYSVDGEWFAPHFEKMLYDNAQLFSLYAEAYAVTQDEEFKKVLVETFEWLQREMTSTDGGFYSALDADSEGVEGKYYVWTQQELTTLLGDDAPVISRYYAVEEHGNWEHGYNILIRRQPDEVFLQENGLDKKDFETQLRGAKQRLLLQRDGRIKPGLDDKIITAWNAMTIVGLTDAYRALQDERFLDAARRNITFLERELMEGTTLYRSFKNRRSTVTAFLDDYAYVIQAYIKLYQVTFEEEWLHKAAAFLDATLNKFYDANEKCFFYTAADAEGLIARRKEIFDNVIPSSNAVMAHNLLHLGIILDRDDWKDLSIQLANSFGQLIQQEPNYMSYWAIVLTEIRQTLAEVVLLGETVADVRKEFQTLFQPFALFMGTKAQSDLPLLSGKTAIQGKPTFYICHNKTCLRPVHTQQEALSMLLD